MRKSSIGLLVNLLWFVCCFLIERSEGGNYENVEPMPGGSLPIPKNEFTHLGKLISSELDDFNKKENTNYKFIRVVSGTYQVVAGLLYKVKAEVEENNSKRMTCEFEILSQAWKSVDGVIEFSCPDRKNQQAV